MSDDAGGAGSPSLGSVATLAHFVRSRASSREVVQNLLSHMGVIVVQQKQRENTPQAYNTQAGVYNEVAPE